MGRAMFSKSLIQFSADGWGCVPSLLFIWGQTMEKVMKIMATSFKRSHACTATLTAPNPAAGHHGPKPPLETPGHSWSSLGGLLWDHCSFFLGPGAHRFCLSPPRVFSQSFVSSVRIVITLLQCYIVTVLAGYQG